MKKFSVLLSIILVAALSSCDYQKNNTIAQKDFRAGDSWVYGVNPDSSAAQLKVKYAAKPELEERVNAIRAKLFTK